MKLIFDRSLLALCAFILIGVTIVRFTNLGFESFWYDELGSLFITNLDWLSIFNYKVDHLHPPLFSLLLKSWTIIIGDVTEAKLRVISFLFNYLSAFTIFLILRNKSTSLYAAIGAVSFLCLGTVFRYSAEIRPYAFGAFLLIQFFYWHFIKKKNTIAFMIYLLALQAHYLLYLYFVILFTFDIFRLRKVSLYHVLALLSACAFFLPYVFNTQLTKTQFWDYGSWSYHYEALSYFFFNTFNFWLGSESVYSIFIHILSLFFIFSLFINILRCWQEFYGHTVLLIILLAITPALLYFILPLNQFNGRFGYFSTPFVSLSIGLALASVKEKHRKVIAFCYMVTLLAFSHHYWSGNFFKSYKKPEWREATSFLYEERENIKEKIYYLSPYPTPYPEMFDFYTKKLKAHYNLEVIIFDELMVKLQNNNKNDFLFVVVDKDKKKIEKLRSEFIDNYQFSLVRGWRKLKIYKVVGISNDK
ncbi:MAG: hypothetical protein K9K67_03895 [Bacteriovoracaceae bacterium]|nr:hypothetical protein [Bacteriovoracaceae bacterium]